MAKWADFGISAVRYSSDEAYIDKVKVHEDKDTKIGPGIEKTRKQVIAGMKLGQTYITILKDNDGKWKKGQGVHIIVVDDEEFIRTDANKKKSDNLENLPEF